MITVNIIESGSKINTTTVMLLISKATMVLTVAGRITPMPSQTRPYRVNALPERSLVDGGVFWKAMTGPGLDAKDIEGSNIRLGMLVAALVYIPAAMAFWFAAPLITWQKMPLGKAC